jgi:hypothetical protein
MYGKTVIFIKTLCLNLSYHKKQYRINKLIVKLIDETMKPTILLLLLVLLQSCYSYKAIDLNISKLIVGHKYKITEDTKYTKVKLKSL